MASNCNKCGGSLAVGQAVCPQCGTSASGTSLPPIPFAEGSAALKPAPPPAFERPRPQIIPIPAASQEPTPEDLLRKAEVSRLSVPEVSSSVAPSSIPDALGEAPKRNEDLSLAGSNSKKFSGEGRLSEVSQEELIEEVTERILKKMTNRRWVWWPRLLLGTVIFFGGFILARYLQNPALFLNFRISKLEAFLRDSGKFSSEGRYLLSEEILPRLKDLKSELDDFEQTSQSVVLKTDAQLSLLDQLSQMKATQKIYSLADEAITGKREAYEELKEALEKSSAPSRVQDLLREQVSRIEKFFNRTWTIRAPEGWRGQGIRTTSELETLLEKSPDWKTRAYSAHLLNDRNESGVTETLIRSARKEKSLFVIRECIKAFAALEGFTPETLLDVEAADLWYQARILKNNESMSEPDPKTLSEKPSDDSLSLPALTEPKKRVRWSEPGEVVGGQEGSFAPSK